MNAVLRVTTASDSVFFLDANGTHEEIQEAATQSIESGAKMVEVFKYTYEVLPNPNPFSDPMELQFQHFKGEMEIEDEAEARLAWERGIEVAAEAAWERQIENGNL
jgi:hypothetical protein